MISHLLFSLSSYGYMPTRSGCLILIKLTGLDLNHCYFGYMNELVRCLGYWACSVIQLYSNFLVKGEKESVILYFNFTFLI